MPTSIREIEISPVQTTAFSSDSRASAGGPVFTMRHELIDAQVEVLRMYMEKKSRDCLLEALDRLIDCTRASFREEEELMICLTGTPDAVHRDMHNELMAQLGMLRQYLMDWDRGRLLAQLIRVDRQLTSHISAATGAPNRQQGEWSTDREAQPGEEREIPLQH